MTLIHPPARFGALGPAGRRHEHRRSPSPRLRRLTEPNGSVGKEGEACLQDRLPLYRDEVVRIAAAPVDCVDCVGRSTDNARTRPQTLPHDQEIILDLLCK